MELNNHPLLQGCAPGLVRQLEALGATRTFAAGQRIIQQGTEGRAVYFLLGGVARVILGDGRGGEITAKVFSAPAFFGEMEALTHTPYIETVEVMRTATVFELSADAMLDLIEHHPRLARNVLIDVCRRFRTSALNQAFMTLEDVERRLATLLMSYVRTFGTRVEGGVQIVTDEMTHQHLASGIGVNEKSIRRTIKRWTDIGLLSRRGRHYVVHDTGQLGSIAGDDSPQLDFVSKIGG